MQLSRNGFRLITHPYSPSIPQDAPDLSVGECSLFLYESIFVVLGPEEKSLCAHIRISLEK